VVVNSLRGVRFEATTPRVLRMRGDLAIAIHSMLEGQIAGTLRRPLILVEGGSLSVYDSKFRSKPVVRLRAVTDGFPFLASARALGCNFREQKIPIPCEEWIGGAGAVSYLFQACTQTQPDGLKAIGLAERSTFPR